MKIKKHYLDSLEWSEKLDNMTVSEILRYHYVERKYINNPDKYWRLKL